MDKDGSPLRFTWFVPHIGSAAFSCASFAIAGGLGISFPLLTVVTAAMNNFAGQSLIAIL